MPRLRSLLGAALLATTISAGAHQRILSGDEAFAAGDYARAAYLWETDARSILRNSRTPYDRRVGAFALVLASMSASTARDARAYALWGEAVGIYAELGLTWSSEAQQYRDQLAGINAAAAVQTELQEGPGVTVDANEQRLLALQVTGIFNYDQPPAGLSVVASPEFDAEPPTDGAFEQRRPSNLIAGRIAAPPGEEPPTADAPVDPPAGPTAATVVPRERLPAGKRPTPPPRRVPSDLSVAAIGEDYAITNRGSIAQERQLTDAQLEWARSAWLYFESVEQPATGLVDTHPGYGFVSSWDIADQFVALISAHQLEIITDLAFDQRVNLLLGTLDEIPLYKDMLPNRNYTANTAELVDASGRPVPVGSGWSAIDVGRMLVWLKVLSVYYPDYRDPAEHVVSRWKLDEAIAGNGLVGVLNDGGKEERFQEGRFGLEQYAARGFQLWGVDIGAADNYAETRLIEFDNRQLRVDTRPNSPANAFPLLLIATEFGLWDDELKTAFDTAMAIKLDLLRQTGKIYALSDYHVDRAPWFANATFGDNQDRWISVSVDGARLPDAVSSLMTTKAVFLMASLTEDADAEPLYRAAGALAHPEFGFFEGRYVDGSINKTSSSTTNAAVLQSLWFTKRAGKPFLSVQRGSGARDDGERRALAIRNY
ncbi:MAG: DUF3131 domain-containing protein [Pseudomonadota bacterium]